MAKVYLGSVNTDWWQFFVDNLNGLSNAGEHVPDHLMGDYQSLMDQGASLYETVRSTANMDTGTATMTLQSIANPVQQWFRDTFHFAQEIGAGPAASPDFQLGLTAAQNFFDTFNETTAAQFIANMQGIADTMQNVADAGQQVQSLSPVMLIGAGVLLWLALRNGEF